MKSNYGPQQQQQRQQQLSTQKKINPNEELKGPKFLKSLY